MTWILYFSISLFLLAGLLYFLLLFAGSLWRIVEASVTGALGLQEMWTQTAENGERVRNRIRHQRLETLAEIEEGRLNAR